MDEPSILDYLKSWFSRDQQIDLSEYFDRTPGKPTTKPKKSKKASHSLLWVVIGMLLALCAQFLLEPPGQLVVPAIFLYAVSAIVFFRNSAHPLLLESTNEDDSLSAHHPEFTNRIKLLFAFLFLCIAFCLFNENQFSLINVGFWFLGVGFLVSSFWEKRIKPDKQPITSLWFIILLIFVFLLSGFFRFYRLGDVPAEMFSDHAEKLLDVMEVLDGETRIFFPRNTGREGLQFYLTAAIIQIFNTGISFLSLKIGTSLAGFLTLPFIYLTGKLIYNKWIGVIAVILTGFSYWHNVISRIGLRFPLYPLFISITLYYLFKGIKTRNINDILISAIFTGLGLHGYSPFRISLLLIGATFLVFLIFEKKRKPDRFIINSILVFSLITMAVFLPLLRYILESPGSFHYRALSRLTSIEKSIDGSIMVTFLENIWKSLTMFFFRNGVVWVNSIPNRPALDFISASFFFIGLVTIIKRIKEFQRWEEILLLISIPILMLPSVLSLAYPQENPALNRSSGAVVPVFLITALGFYFVYEVIIDSAGSGFHKRMAFVLVSAMLALSARENYILVFQEFNQQFKLNAWNSSEIGEVISGFVAQGNSPRNAFVIPYPHWVDTRLVGINAGFPRKDYALWPEQIAETLEIPGYKLFILKPEDQRALDAVELIYPGAERKYFHSKIPGKDFYLIYVEGH